MTCPGHQTGRKCSGRPGGKTVPGKVDKLLESSGVQRQSADVPTESELGPSGSVSWFYSIFCPRNSFNSTKVLISYGKGSWFLLVHLSLWAHGLSFSVRIYLTPLTSKICRKKNGWMDLVCVILMRPHYLRKKKDKYMFSHICVIQPTMHAYVNRYTCGYSIMSRKKNKV